MLDIYDALHHISSYDTMRYLEFIFFKYNFMGDGKNDHRKNSRSN